MVRQRTGARSAVARLACAALLLYVALDFANPLMPGAVCFDPDDTVDAVGSVRSPVTPPPLLPVHAPAAALLPPEAPPDIPPRATASDRGAVRAMPRARAALLLVSESPSDAA